MADIVRFAQTRKGAKIESRAYFRFFAFGTSGKKSLSAFLKPLSALTRALRRAA